MNIEAEVLWLDEQRVVSLRELVELSGLREAELLELVHSGVIPASDVAGCGLLLQCARDHRGAHRLPAARRLRAGYARAWRWRCGCWSACASSKRKSRGCARELPR